MLINIFGLISLLDLVSAKNIFYTSCKDIDNKDDCINEYGCGWCNVSNSNNLTYSYTNICREIDICPVNKSDAECVTDYKYYDSLNCFMFSIFAWIIIILGLLCQIACISALIYNSGLCSEDNNKRRIGLISLFCAMFITGMVILFQNTHLFTNYFFVMFIICILLILLNITQRIRKRNITRYELLANDDSYSINKR